MESKFDYQGWKDFREIGNGSLGRVYEIIKEPSGRAAALKVIPIPKNDEEVDALKDEGYTSEKIAESLKSQADMLFEEYKQFSMLSEHKNIVSCEDVRCIPKTKGLGWNVFARMELLKPINDSEFKSKFDEQDVVAVGTDICTALKECREEGISIHQDINPGNIFRSDDGTYKLGEFGIAKSKILKSRNDSDKDTDDFLPPEVYNKGVYESTSDIFSLGLVLYWLLNERCLPVHPIVNELLPPKNGSEDLKRIVLKACALDPESRYQKPEQMSEELKKVKINSDDNTITTPPPETTPLSDELKKVKINSDDNTITTPPPETTPPRNIKKTGTGGEENPPNWLKWVIITVCALLIGVVLLITSSCDENQDDEVTPESAEPASVTEESVIENVTQMGPFYSGLFEFLNGATIVIPDGFEDVTSDYKSLKDVEKYRYDFYNRSQQIYITLTEGSENDLEEAYNSGTLWSLYGEAPISINGGLLDAMYADEVSHLGKPIYEERNEESYLVTGYSGNDIYYSRVVRLNGAIYSIDFLYPTSNRNVCDQLVVDTEISFSGYHVISGNTSGNVSYSSATVAPNLADLQAMVNSGSVKMISSTNVSLVLPTEKQMLVNPFRARVDNGKSSGSIYIMPKSEKGNGHISTIKTGTEVWIVAQTESFYFFCSDEGDMGWNAKNFFS